MVSHELKILTVHVILFIKIVLTQNESKVMNISLMIQTVGKGIYSK